MVRHIHNKPHTTHPRPYPNVVVRTAKSWWEYLSKAPEWNPSNSKRRKMFSIGRSQTKPSIFVIHHQQSFDVFFLNQKRCGYQWAWNRSVFCWMFEYTRNAEKGVFAHICCVGRTVWPCVVWCINTRFGRMPVWFVFCSIIISPDRDICIHWVLCVCVCVYVQSIRVESFLFVWYAMFMLVAYQANRGFAEVRCVMLPFDYLLSIFVTI